MKTRTFNIVAIACALILGIGAILSVLSLTASGQENPTIGDLRCEYLTAPIGMDEPLPRLSWITETPQRGWRQSAYRILVASDADRLARDEADLWDSGKVASTANSQIAYAGKPPVSRQICHWKVRVWDAAGRASAWSRPATWEMGLLSEKDWQASCWIGNTPPPSGKSVDPSHPTPFLDLAGSNLNRNKDLKFDPGDPAPFLRRAFTIDRSVKRARLYACGLGYAELRLNGSKVGGERVRDPGYTDFSKRVLYVTHDVTTQVKQGENVVGAILGTGWYDVHDLATWNFHAAPWRGEPRLRLLLVIDYDDGTSTSVASDGSWQVATGPIVRDGIYSGEIYDARKELTGWDDKVTDSGGWSPATVLAAPNGRLVALRCPPVMVTETIAPIAITAPAPGTFLVDLGKNIAGHARLTVTAPAGTVITLRYSERVDGKGMIERKRISDLMAPTTPEQLFQTDTYICRGGGAETWEPRFSYHGFRYVEITGFPGTPGIDNLRGRFAHTVFESAGEFSCSNELFNRIQAATLQSYLSNAQSIPTDCPQREKNGWTGDAHLAAEQGLMNFRSAAFYSKWLDDFADNQLADGRVGMIVPTGGWGRGGCQPAWDSAYPLVAWYLYRYCGDVRILERHYDHLRRYVDYLATRTKDGAVNFNSLNDWVPWSTKTSSQMINTAFLYVDADIVAKAADILGRKDDAARYAKLAAATKAAFNTRWLSAEKGTYDNASQCAQSMALFDDLVPTDLRPAVFGVLAVDVERKGHIDTGILGAKYVLRELSAGGRSDLAFRVASRTEQPGWGWWIKQGATTLWEDWKGEASLNHIMFGDISNWFYQSLAGIGLDGQESGHIRIQPQPVGDLTWVKAWHDAPQGRIAVAWKKDGDTFRLDLTIPANARATVWMPATAAADVSEGGRPARQAEGVEFLRQEGDRTVFAIGSGTYAFISRLHR